jgi:hypothetical protein
VIDWFIWAPSEAVAKSVVRASGRALLDEDGNWIVGGPGHALDPDVKIPLKTDPAQFEPGWFANLRITNGEDIAALLEAAAAYGVTVKNPATPRRMWA